MIPRLTSSGLGERKKTPRGSGTWPELKVGHRDGRDAEAESGGGVVVGRLVQQDVVGVRAAHRAGPGQRVDGAANPARITLLAEPVHGAETRREVHRLDVDADVLGVEPRWPSGTV